MPNTFFKFKQFTVNQDRCGMKVCTDACIFGAYVAEQSLSYTPERVLDIGAGTGLLSLMLAQKLSQTTFDAVEIDHDAFRQCTENIANSLWKERINSHHINIQSFAQSSQNSYNLIISNPPFYPEHLQPSQQQKRQAMHTIKLSFEDLLQAIVKLLAPQGQAAILLPPTQSKQLEALAEKYGLYPQKRLFIQDRATKPSIRNIVFYSWKAQLLEVPNEAFLIKNDNGGYTQQFQSLLQDYYLAL